MRWIGRGGGGRCRNCPSVRLGRLRGCRRCRRLRRLSRRRRIGRSGGGSVRCNWRPVRPDHFRGHRRGRQARRGLGECGRRRLRAGGGGMLRVGFAGLHRRNLLDEALRRGGGGLAFRRIGSFVHQSKAHADSGCGGQREPAGDQFPASGTGGLLEGGARSDRYLGVRLDGTAAFAVNLRSPLLPACGDGLDRRRRGGWRSARRRRRGLHRALQLREHFFSVHLSLRGALHGSKSSKSDFSRPREMSCSCPSHHADG